MPTLRRLAVTKLAPLIAHLLFGLCVVALGYSAKNYFGLTMVVVPTIEAIGPVAVDKTTQAISLQLPASRPGESARRLAHGQARELRLLHESWLTFTQIHVLYARNQLIAWSLMSALSLVLVIALHARPKNAG